MEGQASQNQTVPSITPFYGPVYVGDLLTAALWSILCLQTIQYFNKYPKDRIVNKIMVVFLVALYHVELVFIIRRGYLDLISSFGDASPAFNAVPEYLYILPISALMAVSVQGFLTYRIWMFVGKKSIIPIIFIPVAIFELLANIIYVARILTLRATLNREVTLLESYGVNEEKLMLAYYSISPVVDMAIAGFMGYYLSRKSHETRFIGTATALQRLAILSINTGLWTTVFAFLTLILALRLPGTNYYAIPNFPLGALYVNSYLMNLNSRKSQKSLRQYSSPGSTTTSNVFQLGAINHQEDLEVQVTVHREQSKQVDRLTDV